MRFEQLFFFYCGLSSVQGGGEIMRTQWTQTVLRASCLVITAQLPEALWGPAQGPHPHMAGSPRSDLYDTGDMCELMRMNIYDVISPGLPRSQGAWTGSDCGFGHMWGLQ